MRQARALVCGLLAAAFAAPAMSNADLPPLGRSLFDHLTSRRVGERMVQHVPYPFESLLAALEARAGSDALGRPGVAAVLIPLGRSLQRNASPGAYFSHPRVVVALTGEAPPGQAAPLLRDRLFLGFQDETEIIEVISYNERAGRFEFQVVTDYRAGATPKVAYARRAMCTTCHHGGGPIFSRPSWDETNANPAVARALSAHGKAFHGVPVRRGVDVPNAIDDAVARANRIALVQTVWQRGCAAVRAPSDPASCRAQALYAALRLRLAGMRAGAPGFDVRSVLSLPSLAASWQAQWPKGLPEPDPNVPNRDPFFGEAQQLNVERTGTPHAAEEIVPAIDPMTRRAPIAMWRADANGMERFVRALGEMIAAADVAAIARRLAASPSTPRVPQASRSAVEEPRAQHGSDALHQALNEIAEDTRAGRSTVFGDGAFARVPVMKALLGRLGANAGAVCCEYDDAALPPAQPEHVPAARSKDVAAAFQPFFEHCGICHAAASASPPGFLFGDAAAIQQHMTRCAPRIRYRLAMWTLGEAARPKLPMPPPVFVPAWEHTPPRDDVERMLAYVDRQIDPALRERLLATQYETLPACRQAGVRHRP